jgi:hypothetical protein
VVNDIDSAVRVLLRHNQTGFYYCGNHNWVDEVADALDFGTILKAAFLAAEERLGKVTVVVRYDAPECELALPMEACV